jgi:hypothetical protein
MIEAAKNAETANKALEIERIELQVQISQLNVYNANIENAIEELKNNGTYETRAKINLLLHEIIKSINIDFELVDFAIIFKNGVKRFVNDGIIQNVFIAKSFSEQSFRELEEILNYKPPEKI